MTFPEQHFTRMLSFSVTIGLLGAIYGGEPLAYLNETFGYHAVLSLLIYLGCFLAFLVYLIAPDLNMPLRASVASEIKVVLSNPKVILLCILAGFMVGPLEGFADVWGSSFLKEIYAYDHKAANALPSLIFVGMCFGAPVLSFIAEKSKNYLATISGAGFVMTVVFLFLVKGALSEQGVAFGFILVGIACSYQILAIYKASTYVPLEMAGLTTAVANMIIMSFGYAFHSAIGFLIESHGGPFAPEAYYYGIGLIPICLALGTLGFFGFFLREKKTVTHLAADG